MKKIIPALFLALSIIFYFSHSFLYDRMPSTALRELLGCIFYWILALTILSFLSSFLNMTKYKIYLVITLVYSVLTLVVSYGRGGGMGVGFGADYMILFFIFLYSFISFVYLGVQFFKNDNTKLI